jgi:alkyldihydroxyacetonephosphate synthase
MAGGVCVETLETATYWSGLAGLADAARRAVVEAMSSEDAQPIVACHLSHAYETGASLYFTVLVPRDGSDPFGQWQRAKQAATTAIAEHAGTITHHHAVGVDHRPWLTAEIGAVGVEVLRSVKRTLDPTGILNPGKLVP